MATTPGRPSTFTRMDKAVMGDPAKALTETVRHNRRCQRTCLRRVRPAGHTMQFVIAEADDGGGRAGLVGRGRGSSATDAVGPITSDQLAERDILWTTAKTSPLVLTNFFVRIVRARSVAVLCSWSHTSELFCPPLMTTVLLPLEKTQNE